MSNALQLALQVLLTLPQLIQAGRDVRGLLDTTNSLIGTMVRENRDPTPDEWLLMQNMINELRKEIHEDPPA